MNLASVMIGGVEAVANVYFPGTQITQDVGGRNAEAELLFTDVKETAVVGTAIVGTSVVAFGEPAVQSEIILKDEAAVRLFAGHIAIVEPFVEQTIHRYRAKCIDYTWLLETVMIQSKVYTSMSDKAILDDLFATYLPEISTSDVAPVATVDSIEFADISLREAIERIVELTGAEWYIDFNKKIQYYSAGAKAAPWTLAESDTAHAPLAGSITFSKDFSTPANRVRVIGVGGTSDSTVISLNPPASADDGFTSKNAATYPPDAGTPTTNTAGTAASIARDFGGGIYVVTVVLLRFDTSSIPDGATILSANLKLYCTARQDANGGGVQGEYYATANWPIDTGDYTSVVSDSAFAELPVFSLLLAAYNTFALKTPNTSISKTGYTGFRIHLRTTNPPTGLNQATFEMMDGTNKPVLEVTYQVVTAGVEATYNHTASQTLYGRVFARTIIDRKILTNAEALDRATIEANRDALPKESGVFTTRADGLKAGQLLPMVLPSHGISGSYMLRRVSSQWETGSLVSYAVEFGQFRPDLIMLLRKATKALLQ